MLPRWHIVLGAVFTLILALFVSGISIWYLLLLFLASFLIDFDHYICGVTHTRSWNLFHNFEYHKKMEKILRTEKARGIRRKGDFHLFHTVEFHTLIGILGIFWTPLFYIFVGMFFHSMLDLFTLIHKDYLYTREYFFFNWIAKKFE
ncbi:MAG: hypothetical protein AABY00_02575 [Nanoarchaeota archaeon]